jgi:hypothetical protein
VEECPGGDARLVFWEAKHYDNPELRVDDGLPPVCRQIGIYGDYLSVSANGKNVVDSYVDVASNLVKISAMGNKRPLPPMIADVGNERRRLTLGDSPKVGLIIFGFDEGQRDHSGWKAHLAKLKANIAKVRAAGDAKNIRIKA